MLNSETSITPAVETTKETWYEADIHRIAGEIPLIAPEAVRAEAYFERAWRRLIWAVSYSAPVVRSGSPYGLAPLGLGAGVGVGRHPGRRPA